MFLTRKFSNGKGAKVQWLQISSDMVLHVIRTTHNAARRGCRGLKCWVLVSNTVTSIFLNVGVATWRVKCTRVIMIKVTDAVWCWKKVTSDKSPILTMLPHHPPVKRGMQDWHVIACVDMQKLLMPLPAWSLKSVLIRYTNWLWESAQVCLAYTSHMSSTGPCSRLK